MSENTTDNPDYLKGFNEGYTIARHMPDLATQLSDVNIDTERGSGFQDGRKQYMAEQTRAKLPAWLKGERKAKDKPAPDKSRGRDIDPPK